MPAAETPIPSAPPPALELRGVSAGYGRIAVLHDVDLVVPPGSIVALLGANGAGKSTTLGVASGRIRPTKGHVHVAGVHVNGASPAALARAGLCLIPEGRGIFPRLTVAENLRLITYAGGGRSPDDVADLVYAQFPRLSERRRQLAGTMSGGEQQMLAMARALAADPKLLLLDEISMGLAPKIVADLYEIVARLRDNGITVLLVEQFAHTALAIADYAVLMAAGRILRVGQPADVAAHLDETYLGESA
ncbi:MAG TPA: ABC transporter ATP-binding protein [Mycobacteriales bacterium]|nr:ABC transporter ATP-binding protein [Mycobacteriales bacterium]